MRGVSQRRDSERRDSDRGDSEGRDKMREVVIEDHRLPEEPGIMFQNHNRGVTTVIITTMMRR